MKRILIGTRCNEEKLSAPAVFGQRDKTFYSHHYAQQGWFIIIRQILGLQLQSFTGGGLSTRMNLQPLIVVCTIDFIQRCLHN